MTLPPASQFLVFASLILLLINAALGAPPALVIGRCPHPLPPPTSHAWFAMSSTQSTPFVLASGSGYPEEPTVVYACFTDDAIHYKFVAKDSKIETDFTKCNEPLYKMDAVEVFLGKVNFDGHYDLHHYLEVELNAKGALFVSKITNNLLNCTNLSGELQSCNQTGIIWEAGIEPSSWWAYASIPWNLLGAPGGAKQMQNQPYQWKGNFFRIDLLPTGRQFSSWSPTFSDPACFHKPNYFAEWILDFSHNVRSQTARS